MEDFEVRLFNAIKNGDATIVGALLKEAKEKRINIDKISYEIEFEGKKDIIQPINLAVKFGQHALLESFFV